MFTILCIIFTIYIFFKLGIFAIKAAWGITKFFLGVVLSPLILIWLLIVGAFSLALPILTVVGLLTLLSTADAQ